MISEMRCAN